MFTNLAIELGHHVVDISIQLWPFFNLRRMPTMQLEASIAYRSLRSRSYRAIWGDPLSLLGRFKRFRAVFDVAFFLVDNMVEEIVGAGFE